MNPSRDQNEAQEPLASRVVRGGVWVALSSYFNIAFGFFANLILTRILFPEDFGIFSLALFFFSLVNLRTKIGVGFAFAQRKEITGELIGTHLGLDVSAAALNLILAGIAVPVLRYFGYSRDVTLVLMVLAGVSVLDALTATAWGLLDKKLRLGYPSLVSSLVFPISYIPAFILALRGWGYWSLIAQNAVYALLLMIGLWWTLRKQLPELMSLRWSFQLPLAKTLIRFGITVGLASVAGMLATQFDNFLVGTYLGESTLGYYDRAYRIALWPSLLVSSVLTRATFYTYAQLQEDFARLQKTVRMAYWLVTTLALPLALAIFVSASELVRFLWGERWIESAVYLRYLVAYSLIRPLIDNAGMLFIAVGQPRRASIAAVVQAIALILFATPLTFLYGAVGTSIGVGIAYVVGFTLIFYYLKKTVSLSFQEMFTAPILAALLAIGITLLINSVTAIHALAPAIQVALKSTAVVLVFYTALFLIQPGMLVERFGYVWRLFRLKAP